MSRGGARAYLKARAEAIRRHPLLWLLFFLLGVIVGAALTKGRDDPEFSGKMGHRDLSNAQLRKNALETVGALRELAAAMNEADERIGAECDKQADAAKTDSIKSGIRQKCHEEALRDLQGFLSQYEEKYKADVLILREEMLHRLPEAQEERAPPVLYRHPANPLGLREVAIDLEVLAKLLPVKP